MHLVWCTIFVIMISVPKTNFIAEHTDFFVFNSSSLPDTV